MIHSLAMPQACKPRQPRDPRPTLCYGVDRFALPDGGYRCVCGKPFTYEQPGANGKDYDIVSGGPDGNVGTNDDITN